MSEESKRGVKSPRVAHIVATLEGRIRTGVYPGGRWLPTERELREEFDVSRGTVRQALVELERSSLVIRSAGCRPFIREVVERPAPRDDAANRKEAARRTIGLCVKHDLKYSGTYLVTQGVREGVNSDSFRLHIGGANAVTLNRVAEEEAQTLLRMVRDDDISGIVLWYCGGDANLPILRTIQQAHIPLVFVDRAPPTGIEADYVSIDNQHAACEAVRFLIRRQHKRIAHITNPEPVSTVYERLAGYEAALEKAGIPLDPALILTGRIEGMAEEGLNANEIVDRLLGLSDPPTAIFAVTDYIALAIVRALQERGKRVPEDMAIIGFDDLEHWLPHRPFLTTVHQPFERIGFEAARLLIKRLESDPTHHSRHVMLEAPLIVRQSA